MAGRIDLLDIVKVHQADTGRHQAAWRITCGQCGSHNVMTLSGGQVLTAQTALTRFARKGWAVGAAASRHRCPGCNSAQCFAVKDETKGRRTMKKATSPNASADQSAVAKAAAPAGLNLITAAELDRIDFDAAEPPKPVPPRQMTREDRRVILMRINDVYLDEVKGYDAGWSDKRVADDLGVPRAWVATLREENFGTAGDNEDVRALLSRYGDLVKEVSLVGDAAKAAVERAGALLDTARDHLAFAEDVRRRAEAVQSEIAKTARDAAAIRKAVC